LLIEFLAKYTNSSLCKHFGRKLSCYYGKELHIDYKNDLMGPLTMNVGIGEYKQNRYRFVLNIRYPNDADVDRILTNLQAASMHQGRLLNDSKPLFVDPQSPYVQALLASYQKVTGDLVSQPFTIGGGTYARQTVHTVAFGMEFPLSRRGSGNIHSPDECLHIEDLLDGIEVYYEALLRLVDL
jgi:succinyl-diaminopimelate desuccinylase